MILFVLCALLLLAQSREKRIAPVDAGQRQSFDRQPKIAVLAGVGHYPSRSGLSQLRYPAHDVELLEAELKKHDYKVVALKDSDATRGSIEQALRDAAEMVDRGQGTVLFFFSGHGFADRDTNYLATFEATSGNLAGTGMAVKEVEELLKATGAPRQVVLIDACRNEPGKAAGARSFERFEASAGMRELFSTKAGHISYEDDQFSSGVFTHFVVEGLTGEAAGRDGLITFRDLADYVTNAVETFGFERGHMQVPYEAGESSGDFLLARKASGGTIPPPIVDHGPHQADSGTPGPFDDFFRQFFPNVSGWQSALAGVQIGSLNSEAASLFKIPSTVVGVLVTGVDGTSAAGHAGLQKHDVLERVNLQKVTTPAEFDNAVRAGGKRQLLLLVYRPIEGGAGASRFIVVENANQ
jgi:hypothetical protein